MASSAASGTDSQPNAPQDPTSLKPRTKRRRRWGPEASEDSQQMDAAKRIRLDGDAKKSVIASTIATVQAKLASKEALSQGPSLPAPAAAPQPAAAFNAASSAKGSTAPSSALNEHQTPSAAAAASSSSAGQSGGTDGQEAPAAAAEKQQPKPNFGLSGALQKDAQHGNVYKGIQMRFSEPPEARVPSLRWQLHVFKGSEPVGDGPLYVCKQSAYLIGRDTRVADVHALHPSCSSQHAVLQFRLVDLPGKFRPDGTQLQSVRPYILDLESTHGTFLNGEKIVSARYVSLRARDTLRFGLSSREYVLMHDRMKELKTEGAGTTAASGAGSGR